MKHRVVLTVEGNKITDVVEVYGGDVARIPKCSVLPPQLPSDHIILFLPKEERMFIGIAKKADWWHRKDIANSMEKYLFGKTKVWKKYSNKEVAKLERYRRMLIRVLNKYWDSKTAGEGILERKLYKHQEARIWRMINMEFPDIVILDGHYND